MSFTKWRKNFMNFRIRVKLAALYLQFYFIQPQLFGGHVHFCCWRYPILSMFRFWVDEIYYGMGWNDNTMLRVLMPRVHHKQKYFFRSCHNPAIVAGKVVPRHCSSIWFNAYLELV